MPSFTTSVPDLERDGPLLRLSVGMSRAAEQSLELTGAVAPAPIVVTALVDTGAERTILSKGLPNMMGLQPVGLENVHTASSINERWPIFSVRLLLPRDVIREITALEAQVQEARNIQVLLGRDVLKAGVLLYVGPENQFTLSF